MSELKNLTNYKHDYSKEIIKYNSKEEEREARQLRIKDVVCIDNKYPAYGRGSGSTRQYETLSNINKKLPIIQWEEIKQRCLGENMNIKTGSKWRRRGEIITVTKVTPYAISFSSDRGLPLKLFKERFEFVSNLNEEPEFGTQEYIDYWKKQWEDGISVENAFNKSKDRADRWYPVKDHGASFEHGVGEVRFREIKKKEEPSLTTIADFDLSTVRAVDTAIAADTVATMSAAYDTDTHISGDLHVSGNLLVKGSTTTVDNNSNTKENEMKETNIKIEVNGKEIELCKNAAAACLKPKTDLEARKKYTIVIFDATGAYSETIYVNAKNDDKATKKMTAMLQKPANLGKTATLHKEVTAMTTDIPVVKING